MPSLEPLPPSSREKRAEQQYKNIQVLGGIPADRLQSIMESFSAALGVNCTYCHIKGQEEKDDKQAKQIARKMIRLTLDVNKQIGGLGRVTCYTCHRGQPRPAS
jgi:photosynthetic reaction center cytochrome c subunit